MLAAVSRATQMDGRRLHAADDFQPEKRILEGLQERTFPRADSELGEELIPKNEATGGVEEAKGSKLTTEGEREQRANGSAVWLMQNEKQPRYHPLAINSRHSVV